MCSDFYQRYRQKAHLKGQHRFSVARKKVDDDIGSENHLSAMKKQETSPLDGPIQIVSPTSRRRSILPSAEMIVKKEEGDIVVEDISGHSTRSLLVAILPIVKAEASQSLQKAVDNNKKNQPEINMASPSSDLVENCDTPKSRSPSIMIA